jgi:hypothetical protein
MRRKRMVTKRRFMPVGLLLAGLALLAGCSEPTPAITKTAESLVDSMAKADFPSATRAFSTEMKSQIPSDKLAQVWSQVAVQAGPFKGRTGTREAQEQGYDVVYVSCQFEKGSIDVKVVFDSKKRIAGLFVVPSQSPSRGG